MTPPTRRRFLTFWPDEARLVHTVDLHAAAPWRAMCGAWSTTGDDWYDVPAGEGYLRCATCARREAARGGAPVGGMG